MNDGSTLIDDTAARVGFDAPRPHVTPEQEQLLKIIYLPDDEALPLFRQWYASVDMQDLDPGCYRLYPHLYQKIKTLEPANPFLGRLRGNYRKSIYHNHLLFHRAAQYVARLNERRIPSIVLKGAAFVKNVDPNVGLRPMADIDVLVRAPDVAEALVLLSPGHRTYAEDREVMEGWLRFRHAISLRSRAGLEMDLHWHLLPGWSFLDDPDAPFWDASVEGDFFGARTRYLCATDFLFHTCGHGVRWNAVPSIRWVSDSLDVLNQSAAEFDWNRMLELTDRYQLHLVMATAFRYLRDAFAAPIPSSVLTALTQRTISPLERIDFELGMREWTAAISWDEARQVCDSFVDLFRAREPASPLVFHAHGKFADARSLDWCGSRNVEYLFEFPEGTPAFDLARAQIVKASRSARIDPGRASTLRLAIDPDIDGRLRRNMFATLERAKEGLKFTVFATDIRRPSASRIALRPWNAYWIQAPVCSGLMKHSDKPMLPLAADFFRVASAS